MTVSSLVAELEAARQRRDISRLQSIVPEFESIGTDAALIESYVARAALLAIENRNAESAELYNRVLEYRTQHNDRLGIAKTSLDLGSVLNEHYDFDRAMMALKVAHEIFEDLNDVHGIIGAQSCIGVNHFYRGLLPESLSAWEPALKLALANNEQYFIATISLNLGNAMSRLGQFPTALEYYHKSLAISENNDALKSSKALCFNNIGITYYSACCNADALEWWYRAMDLYKELGNEKMQGFITENMANLHVSTSNFAKALVMYDEAIAVFERLNTRQPLANCFAAKSSVFLRMGDFVNAQIWRTKAYELYEELGIRASVIDIKVRTAQEFANYKLFDEAKELIDQVNIEDIHEALTIVMYHDVHGQVLEQSAQLNEAREIYETMLRISTDHALKMGESAAHQGLRDLAKAQGDIDAYIEHNDEYQRINNEVFGREAALKLAVLEKQKEMQIIEQERERERSVLYSTLPKHIADRVITGETVNDYYDNAAVLFLDIVGFTTLSSTLTSQQVTTLLDAVFGICDEACNRNNVTRVKTIGDSYLAFCEHH